MNRNIVLLALSLIAMTSLVDAGTYTEKRCYAGFTVVPDGSMTKPALCNLFDGKAFPGDEVIIQYTVKNVGNVKLENVVLHSELFGNIKLPAKKLIPHQVTAKGMKIIAPSKPGAVVSDKVTLNATYKDAPDAHPDVIIEVVSQREKPDACRCPNEK